MMAATKMKGAGSAADDGPKRRVTETSAAKDTNDDVLEGWDKAQ